MLFSIVIGGGVEQLLETLECCVDVGEFEVIDVELKEAKFDVDFERCPVIVVGVKFVLFELEDVDLDGDVEFFEEV